MEINNQTLEKIYQIDPEYADQFIIEAIDYFCSSLRGEPRPVLSKTAPRYQFLELASSLAKWDDQDRQAYLEELTAGVQKRILSYPGAGGGGESEEQTERTEELPIDWEFIQSQAEDRVGEDHDID